VKDALDLCLACKGCKADCPVNVDMATYKAEFLSHYYEHRARPIHAYAFGLIHVWARLAQIAPGLVNLVNRAPLTSDLFKSVLGIADARKIPQFAPRSFKSWFRKREARNPNGRLVLLWPDTFNNFFHVQTAQAAVEVLEHAGFRVVVPKVDLCCGRPLYDYGMLGTARRWLAQILDHLKEEIEEGVPLVGLEPSCTAVFRDELKEMFPRREQALRLAKQTFTLAEFFTNYVRDYEPPRLERKALLQGHCHHKAVMKLDTECELLGKMKVDFELLDSGCCGMAGAFGFERDHYDVSIACGERVLLPRVRKAPKDTLIIADGFSCREQIRQTTDRTAIHLADAMKLAIEAG